MVQEITEEQDQYNHLDYGKRNYSDITAPEKIYGIAFYGDI